MSDMMMKSELPPFPDTPIVDLSVAEREQLNLRRAERIDRQSQSGLSSAEATELARLQQQWGVYLSSVAPLPWDKLALLEAQVAAEEAERR